MENDKRKEKGCECVLNLVGPGADQVIGLADCLDQQLKGSLHSQWDPDERLTSRIFSSKAWLNLQRDGIRGHAAGQLSN